MEHCSAIERNEPSTHMLLSERIQSKEAAHTIDLNEAAAVTRTG